MAVVFSNNATTVLSSNITNSATSIAVQDGSVFPTLSGTDYFYATLQDPGNTKREIVKVTARSGNTLTVTRAVDGSSASAFSANDAFELRLNAAALNDAVNSGTADLELNSFTGDGSEVDFTLSMEALEANTLVYIDGVYQNKTAYSISGYVLTFSAAPDNGAAIEVTTATVAPIQESTDFLLNQFTGDGSDTTFTLSSSPEENQTTVFISGVYQSKSNYSISGTTLTFSTAPPASSSIEVMVARTVVYGIGTPSNDTVSTAKIVDGAVTPAKLSLTYATETFVGTAVSNLVDSSPAALDTLNELAAALGDDPNFATTVTNSIALKAPLASPSFTGNVGIAANNSGQGAVLTLENTDTSITTNDVVGQIDFYANDGSTGGTGQKATIQAIAQNGSGTSVGLIFGTSPFPNTTATERMRMDASGNVGIGESSPSGLLHLKKASDTADIILESSGGSGKEYLIGSRTDGSLNIYDVTASTERMRIDSSGRQLIGYTSSVGTAYQTNLQVKGSSASNYGGLGIVSSSNEMLGVVGTWSNGENSLMIAADPDNLRPSSSIVFTTDATERFRIFNSGNITQTGSSSADFLIKAPTDNASLTLQAGASDTGAEGAFVNFLQNTTYKWQMGMNTDNSFRWYNYATSSEAMRIDSSGNLLVGQTANAETGTGIGLVPDGTSHMYSGSTDALMLGRGGNDGDILSFNKSGTTVGSIGVTGTNDIEIHSTTANHTGLRLGEGYYLPTNNTGATADNAVDLGLASIRYKDLYLSGGTQSAGSSTFTGATPMSFNKAGSDTYTKTVLYDSQNNTPNSVFSGLTLEMGRLTNSGTATPRTFTITDRGATNRWCFSQYGLSFNPTNGVASAAESLDSYEEGTWTPVIKAVGAGGNTATATVHGPQYTKVGRLVNVSVYISGININAITAGTYITLQGLPFAGTSYADFTIAYKGGDWSTSGNIIGGYVQPGTSYAYFMRANGVEAQQTSTDVTMTKAMINITYQAS